MFRELLLSSLLLAGLSGAAMARENANMEAFIARQPHSQPVSQGVPVIVGSEDGQPVIRYEGQPRGNLSRNVPAVVVNKPASR